MLDLTAVTLETASETRTLDINRQAQEPPENVRHHRPAARRLYLASRRHAASHAATRFSVIIAETETGDSPAAGAAQRAQAAAGRLIKEFETVAVLLQTPAATTSAGEKPKPPGYRGFKPQLISLGTGRAGAVCFGIFVALLLSATGAYSEGIRLQSFR